MRRVRAVRGGVLERVGAMAPAVLQDVANLRRVLRHIGKRQPQISPVGLDLARLATISQQQFDKYRWLRENQEPLASQIKAYSISISIEP